MEVIDFSAHEPRRIPSKKWRELIKKVWEVDPLRCSKCSAEIRIVSLFDQEDVIERILRHLGLWQEGVRVHSGTDPPGETTLDRWLDDPFPRLRHRTRDGVLRQRPSAHLAPLVQRRPALRRQLFRVAGAQRNPKKVRV